MSINVAEIGVLSGYQDADKMIATRKKMGGRWVIHLDMSITQLLRMVDDPVGKPQDENREVNSARCKAFANYLDETPGWGSPSLMLRCPRGTVTFEPIEEINSKVAAGVQVGIVGIPRVARSSIKILDGQHRIGGSHEWQRLCQRRVDKEQEHLSRARRQNEPHLMDEAISKVATAKSDQARLDREFIGIDLIEVDSAEEAKQIFADIANNAKGISKALTTSFDRTKVVNRATQDLITDNPHLLLDGRVDFSKDRLGGSNPHLLSAKAVADIVRTTYVGIGSKVTRKHEKRNDDKRVITNASKYFDAIAEAFPDLMLVDPPQLRTISLLGSGTTLRALAGAWYDLTKTTSANDEPVPPLMSEEDVTEFFQRLAPHMGAPIRPRNKWRKTGAFPGVTDGKPVMAPSSRTQDLKALSNKIRAWALQDEPLPF